MRGPSASHNEIVEFLKTMEEPGESRPSQVENIIDLSRGTGASFAEELAIGEIRQHLIEQQAELTARQKMLNEERAKQKKLAEALKKREGLLDERKRKQTVFAKHLAKRVRILDEYSDVEAQRHV